MTACTLPVGPLVPSFPDALPRHYERHLGFSFTDEERADLPAFLNTL